MTTISRTETASSERDMRTEAVAQPGTQRPVPKLPHERDETSTGATAAQPDAQIQQAFDDLEAGQVDTDLRGVPGIDVERQKRLARQG